MKRNYWPLFFIGIFGFTFAMIIWTIKSAVSLPVVEDKSFMKKYQDVDDHFNEMMDSNKLFLSKYDFELILNDKKTGKDFELHVSGVFVAVGQIPKNETFADTVKLDEGGFVLASEDCLTSHPGIFAAGDCRTKEVRQLTTAAADGAVAALAACKYIADQSL